MWIVALVRGMIVGIASANVIAVAVVVVPANVALAVLGDVAAGGSGRHVLFVLRRPAGNPPAS